MSSRKTFYFCLDVHRNEQEFAREALDRLLKYISLEPFSITHIIEQLPVALVPDVQRIITNEKNDMLDCLNDWTYFSLDKWGGLSNLLVICSPNSHVAKAILKSNPAALWGGSNGQFSAVYEPMNEFVLWHETLHLLGAEDCYNLEINDEGPTCECSNCIMQYAPTQNTVGTWPFLCDGNINRIRERVVAWNDGGY